MSREAPSVHLGKKQAFTIEEAHSDLKFSRYVGCTYIWKEREAGNVRDDGSFVASVPKTIN